MARLFVAIEVPRKIIQYACDMQTVLMHEKVGDARLTDAEQMHITLAFMPGVPESQIAMLMDMLARVQFRQQTAYLGHLGVFWRNADRAVVFVHVICPALALLSQQLNSMLFPWVHPEKNDFVSHLTLMRVKQVKDKEQLMSIISTYPVEPLEFCIDAFVLKKSILNMDGAHHTTLRTYSLQSTI